MLYAIIRYLMIVPDDSIERELRVVLSAWGIMYIYFRALWNAGLSEILLFKWKL